MGVLDKSKANSARLSWSWGWRGNLSRKYFQNKILQKIWNPKNVDPKIFKIKKKLGQKFLEPNKFSVQKNWVKKCFGQKKSCSKRWSKIFSLKQNVVRKFWFDQIFFVKIKKI